MSSHERQGWQLTLPGSPAPRCLLVEFAVSCCVFISLGGGFVLAGAYQKRSGARICVKESAGEVSFNVVVTSRRITQGKRLFLHPCSGLRSSELWKVILEVFSFSAELTKPFLVIQCSQGSACVLKILNVFRGSEESRERSADSSVKIKGSLYDLFYRL